MPEAVELAEATIAAHPVRTDHGVHAVLCEHSSAVEAELECLLRQTPAFDIGDHQVFAGGENAVDDHLDLDATDLRDKRQLNPRLPRGGNPEGERRPRLLAPRDVALDHGGPVLEPPVVVLPVRPLLGGPPPGAPVGTRYAALFLDAFDLFVEDVFPPCCGAELGEAPRVALHAPVHVLRGPMDRRATNQIPGGNLLNVGYET